MTDELLDLTVDEQKNELENLNIEELEQLREEETRQTAVDNINQELSDRQPEEQEKEGETESEPVEDNQEPVEEQEENTDLVEDMDEQSIVEAKLDYLIEKCKTTSQQGFENWMEERGSQ